MITFPLGHDAEAPEADPADRAGGISQEALDAVAPRRRPRPAAQNFIAFCSYLVAWLAAGALPLIIHPGRAQLEPTSMDPNFYVWSLRWWPYAITHGLSPLHSALAQAPAGVSLGWTTTIPPLAILAWPVTAIAGPVVSFNLLVALSLPVSAWSAFFLCRRITGRFWPSLAAGAVFGFSAYHTSHILEGQLNLSFDPLLPLMAYLVVVWLDKKIGPRLFIGLMALVLAAQFYLFIETFADLTVLLVAAVVCGYLLAGPAGRPVVAKLAGQVGLAYAMALVLAAPYLLYAVAHVPHGFVRSPDGVSLDLLNLVMAKSGNALGLGWLTPTHSVTWARGGFVGIPLLVVAILLTVGNWSNKLVRFLAIMILVVLVAALGPAIRVNGDPVFAFPWGPLWHLPIVRSSFPVRIMVFAFLVLAVMMAIWLAMPAKRPWLLWLRWLVASLAVLAIVTNTAGLGVRPTSEIPPFIGTGQYKHYIARRATVVVIATHIDNAGLLWQAETGFYFKLAGGFFNEALGEDVIPPAISQMVTGKNTTLNAAKISDFRTLVRTAHLSAILVRAGSAREWQWIFARLGLRAHWVGGVILYQISRKYLDSSPGGRGHG